MSKKEKEKQGWVQRALCTAHSSIHFKNQLPAQESNLQILHSLVNFALSFSEGRTFTYTLTEVTTSPAAQCETAGRSTQRYRLCEI